MSNITDFVIENGVLKKYKGNDANVVIPNSVTEIGGYAFSGCTSLTSVTISNSVTKIESGIFSGCASLANVVIPDNVTEICKSVFFGCASLTNITVEVNNPEFYSDGNCIIYKDTHELIVGCGNSTIPTSVTEIGGGAFAGCTSLTSVTIPDGVTAIGESAFMGCTSLTSVTIPNGVTEIGKNAFKNCTSLASVTIPGGVTVVDEYAFSDCTSLTSVTIPDGVTEIGGYTFSNCTSLKKLCIPESVTAIDFHAFEGCTDLAFDAQSINTLTFIHCEIPGLQRFVKGKPIADAEEFRITANTEAHEAIASLLKQNPEISVVLDDEACASGQALTSFYADCLHPTDRQYACLILYQEAQGWQSYLRRSVNCANVNAIMAECVSIMQTMKKSRQSLLRNWR